MSGRDTEGVDFNEAMRLSGLTSPSLGDTGDEYDPDLADLNNPDVEALPEAPVLGGKAPPSDMFGIEADHFGRTTSPKLYAQAGQFPTAAQFRVWRWENGIPVGLGAIDIEASEDDMVRLFFDAMPRPGDGRFMFKLRPIDVRGNELGKEITVNISEHHQMVKYMRDQKRRDEEERMEQWGRRGGGGDVYVQGAGGDPQVGATYAEEMGRMFEQAVGAAEERTLTLQQTLEMERDRLRLEEKERAEERVNMAGRSAEVVQQMTEKMMETERLRSQETVAGQKEHSQLLLSTISTVFTQQQEAARQQNERMRESDSVRMKQDREFFDRQRIEAEERRRQDREEADRKRAAEKAEWEQRRIEERERLQAEAARMADNRKYEMEQMRLEAERREQDLERRRSTEKAEAERRRALDKEEAERRLEQQKMELSHRQEQLRLEAEQRRTEAEERRRSEEAEWTRRREVEREEKERKERADRERWDREKQEMQQKLEEQRRLDDRRREEEVARLAEQRRLDDLRREEERRAEERRRTEELARLEMLRLESEKKREEERRMEDRRREQERQDWDRRETQRREETARQDRERQEAAQREAARRTEEMQLQMKQMEQNAQRDREHAERMMEMARLERETQREGLSQREKSEREAREQAERDRQRQHDLAMREMEMSKERDREHAERMIQLSKIQSGGGGIIEQLGMETPELLQRIFGGGSEAGEEGWADAIPKVLGSIADLGKVAMQNKQQNERGRRPVAGGGAATTQPMIPIQTAEGVKLVPASAIPAGVVVPGVRRKQPLPPGLDLSDFSDDLPDEAQVPPDQVSPAQNIAPAPAVSEPPPPPEEPDAYMQGVEVNTLRRSKKAGLSMQDQKKARKAIRDLGTKLGTADEEKWLGIITAAITKEVGIFYYIKAVTVYAALAEAKIEPALAERIVVAMRESGLIPDDVPYDEEDYVLSQGALAALAEAAPEATAEAQEEAEKLAEAPVPPAWPDTQGGE